MCHIKLHASFLHLQQRAVSLIMTANIFVKRRFIISEFELIDEIKASSLFLRFSDSVRCTVSSFRFRTTQRQRKQSGVRAKKQTKKTQSELEDRESLEDFDDLDDFELCEINIAIIHCCKDFGFERIDFFVIVSISLIESDNVSSM